MRRHPTIARAAAPEAALRISGKQLGDLALPNACPRCLWLKLRLRHRLPFEIFPGIFSTIDSFVKHVVHAHFVKHGRPPPWLAGLGELVRYIEPPHWSRFQMYDRDHDVLLTGMPDALFVRTDRTHVIGDYKTARFTDAQDELLPMYEVQLNAYAAIAEHCDFAPVADLALIYMEPATDPSSGHAACCGPLGFDMGFSAHVLTIKRTPNMLAPLLARARELADLDAPPPGRRDCKECGLVAELSGAVTARKRGRCHPKL